MATIHGLVRADGGRQTLHVQADATAVPFSRVPHSLLTDYPSLIATDFQTFAAIMRHVREPSMRAPITIDQLRDCWHQDKRPSRPRITRSLARMVSAGIIAFEQGYCGREIRVLPALARKADSCKSADTPAYQARHTSVSEPDTPAYQPSPISEKEERIEEARTTAHESLEPFCAPNPDLPPEVAGPGRDSPEAVALEAWARQFGSDDRGNSYAFWAREACTYSPAAWVRVVMERKVAGVSRRLAIYVLTSILAQWRDSGGPPLVGGSGGFTPHPKRQTYSERMDDNRKAIRGQLERLSERWKQEEAAHDARP